MPYGTIKVDNITFTNGGSDQTVTVSGLYASTSGNLTVTGTVSGTTANFVSGTFSTQVSGATVTGNVGKFTTITGGSATLTTATITSGIFAAGTAAAPSVAVGVGTTNTPGIYSPGTNQLALATGGSGRLFIDSSGNVGVGQSGGSRGGSSTRFLAKLASGQSFIEVQANGTSDANALIFSDGSTGNYGAYGYDHSNDSAYIQTAGNDRIRITSGGLVGIGTILPTNTAGFTQQLELAGSLPCITINQNNGAFTTQKYSLGVDSVAGFGIWNNNANAYRFYINSSGLVGIGSTNDPGSLGSKLWIDNSTDTWFSINTTGSTNIAGIHFRNSNANGEARLLNNTGGALTFYRNISNEAARIDSSGRLLLATSSSTTVTGSGYLGKLQIANNGNAGLGLHGFYNGSPYGADILFTKSRSGTIGTNTIIQDGDEIGVIWFAGANGTGYDFAASIKGIVDGTPGASGDMPGRLVFSTTADGASSPTERARINNTGYLTGTVNGLSQGLYACEQYYRLNANLARSDVSTAQSIFGVGVTLIASTIYEFEVVFALAKTAGTNSHTIGIGFGGTATLNNILYELIGANALAYPSSAAPDVQNLVDVVTNTTMTSAITTAARNFRAIIKGTVSVNAGGTFIPQFTLSAAPVGGAYSTLGGSYIKIAPLGASGANISIGSWA